jgi:hypothetical protein
MEARVDERICRFAGRVELGKISVAKAEGGELLWFCRFSPRLT